MASMLLRAAVSLILLHLGQALGTSESALWDAGSKREAKWELTPGYDGLGPTVDDTDHPDGDADALPRRLADPAEHEGVPTDVFAEDQDVELDWLHDFEILKPVIGGRGFDIGGVDHLCKLPCVYCASGYRRRVPSYATTLMGDDWVGREYQLVLPIKDESVRAEMDPALFDLRRVGFFQVFVNAGAMPQGLERLQSAKVIWIEGNSTHGLEGGLPSGFWALRARMFLLASMGSQFTGELESDLPMCEYLDYRLYLYRLPAFSGNIFGISACRKIVDTIEVFRNPRLGGNVWSAMLGWDALRGSIAFWGSHFEGSIPYASTSSQVDGDRWVQWCRQTARSELSLRITQAVNGPLPAGLNECARKFSRFHVAGCGLSGAFPLNFSEALAMHVDGITVYDNAFTGAIPDIPPQLETIDLHGNRWSGNTPLSWTNASALKEVDLSDCDMVGDLPDIPSHVASIKLRGNRFTGPVPQSWFANSDLEEIDLSNNKISGPPFTWGWVNSDPNLNYDVAEFLEVYSASPDWPLKVFKIDNNPLGISAGFFLAQLAQYTLEAVHATNCQLHGYVNSEDLYSQRPKTGGGVEVRPGAVAMDNLRTLDLGGNDIKTFGYNDLTGTASTCWQEEIWSLRLRRLEILSLQGNPSLRHVNPNAYKLTKELDVRDTPSLVGPPVFDDASFCAGVFNESIATCSGESWGICVWKSNIYVPSAVDETRECSGVKAQRLDATFNSLRVTPEILDLERLCRCRQGFQASSSGSCGKATASIAASAGEEDEGVEEASAADESVLTVVLVVAGAAFVLLACLLAVTLSVLHRRWQRALRSEKAADEARHQTALATTTLEEATAAAAAATERLQATTSGMSPSDSGARADHEHSATAPTEEVFKDMDLAEIVSLGLKEHWLIPKEHIRFVQGGGRAGGFGEVKKAALLGSTDVAIKIPSGRGGVETKIKASHAKALVNEMRLFRRIRHPNIVLFHGVTAMRDGADPVLCLVLEWIDKGDYGNYVKQRRKNGLFSKDVQQYLANPKSVCYEHKILIDIARGMQYLHGQKPPIMHRDLKPGNVLIEMPEPPRAKLADFGLSTLLQTAESKRAGTSAYMAPEVAAQTAYDLSADAFSFGCICLFTLTGARPNAGKQQQECRGLLSDPELPAVIAEVGVECLHHEPSERTTFAAAYRKLSEGARQESSTYGDTTTSTTFATGTTTSGLLGNTASPFGSAGKQDPISELSEAGQL